MGPVQVEASPRRVVEQRPDNGGFLPRSRPGVDNMILFEDLISCIDGTFG